MCCFALFLVVISFTCSKTADYGARRIRHDFKAIKTEMALMREDITSLFDKTDHLNMSAVESCGRCISGNTTSRPPAINYGERQDMVKVNDNSLFVKYHRLIKAFVSEKHVHRQLQDKVRSMQNTISVNKKLAGEIDRELQSQLLSMEDVISDIRNNMTLMSIARDLKDNERDRDLQHQLRSMKESIEDKISNIHRDLHDNMTSFMTTISNKIDEHFRKVETTSVKPEVTTVPIVYRNCRTVPNSGVYTINLKSIMSPVSVYCDQDTDGGGWIVFMRRKDGSVNFNRLWSDYKHGFGSPEGEFWVGNEFLYMITKAKPLQLRIDMEDFNGHTAFAVYEEFKVGTEEDKYRLHVTGYSGTAGDSLIDTMASFFKHAGMQFSTTDSDNDNYIDNCAKDNKAGWWYNHCYGAKLTGPYRHDKNVDWPEGIIWSSWKGYDESLRRVEMKIR